MGATLRLAIVLALGCVAHAQYYSQTTPVPILKQINRHNDDGSYSYGYEGADGSFKIETKLNTGEVMGKYGYVDDSGKVREVEYGASQRGFEPAGTGINVAPPTLNGNYVGPDGHDDGQYHEDPSVYYKNPQQYNANNAAHRSYTAPQSYYSNNPAPQSYYNPPAPKPQSYYNPPAPKPQYYNPPAPQPQYNSPAPQPQYNAPAPQPQYNPPAPQTKYYTPPQQSYYNPPAQRLAVDPSLFKGHPATNFNIDSGSYSISYAG